MWILLGQIQESYDPGIYPAGDIPRTRTVVHPGSRLLFYGSSRFCRRYAYISPVLLELLLVLVELASERGYGTAGPARRPRTQSGCDLTNGPRMSCAVLVAGTRNKEQLTDPDARQLLPSKKRVTLFTTSAS